VRRRTVVDGRLLAALRFREAVAFRAVLFRELAARLRAAPLVFRETAVRFRLPAALRFRLPPARALPRRLPAAARLVFFLPRGGILLLRELGSQSAAGVANSLPAFFTGISHRDRGSLRDSVARNHHCVAIRVVVERFRMNNVDAKANLAHHLAVLRRVYTRFRGVM
jgi:hypothetical protein